MSHVAYRYPVQHYAETLMSTITHSLGMSRWNAIHGHDFRLYELDYPEFVAQFAFLLPEKEIENTREDYQLLLSLVYEHWVRLDYPEVILPSKFDCQGNYYVFEVGFGQ